MYRVHAASRYALVWHQSHSHAVSWIGAYQPPVLVEGLPTVSAAARPHGRWGYCADTWRGGDLHTIDEQGLLIDGCCCTCGYHGFDHGRHEDAAVLAELPPLIEWTVAHTKRADLMELVPVPPLVDENLGPSPVTMRIGAADLTVTDDNDGDPLQRGERYVLDLRRTGMRMTVHAFLRTQSLVNDDETALETHDVPQVRVDVDRPPERQVVTVKVGDARAELIDGSGRHG